MSNLNESFEREKQAQAEKEKQAEADRNFDVPLTRPVEENGRIVFDREKAEDADRYDQGSRLIDGRVPWENNPDSKLDSCF